MSRPRTGLGPRTTCSTYARPLAVTTPLISIDQPVRSFEQRAGMWGCVALAAVILSACGMAAAKTPVVTPSNQFCPASTCAVKVARPTSTEVAQQFTKLFNAYEVRLGSNQ